MFRKISCRTVWQEKGRNECGALGLRPLLDICRARGYVLSMNKPPLPLVYDYVFKRVFGEHLSVLADLLQAVLSLPVTEHDIRVVNPNFAADKKSDKLSSLDVKVETRQYGVIDVEIQVEDYDYLWKRFQYYTARMYVEQMHSGDGYEKLTKAISIVIIDFKLFCDDAACHHCFRLHDVANNVEYPESIEINILEIPKRHGNISKVSRWLEFFAARTEEEFMQLAHSSPEMEKAWGVIKQLSADEQERAEAEAIEKARRDVAARLRSAEMKGREEGLAEGRVEGLAKGLAEGRTEGKAEGLAEGKVEERLGIVSYMHGQGRTPDEISTTIGLSLDEVVSLISKIKSNR